MIRPNELRRCASDAQRSQPCSAASPPLTKPEEADDVEPMQLPDKEMQSGQRHRPDHTIRTENLPSHQFMMRKSRPILIPAGAMVRGIWDGVVVGLMEMDRME